MSVTFILELLGGESDGEQLERTYGSLEEVHGTIYRLARDGMPRQAVTIDPDAGMLLEHETYRIMKASEHVARRAFQGWHGRRAVAVMGEKPVLRYAIVRDTPGDA